MFEFMIKEIRVFIRICRLLGSGGFVAFLVICWRVGL